MVDMLLAGDRAVVNVRGDIQTWSVGYDKTAQRNGQTLKVWFDGKNYRVGQFRVVARV